MRRVRLVKNSVWYRSIGIRAISTTCAIGLFHYLTNHFQFEAFLLRNGENRLLY